MKRLSAIVLVFSFWLSACRGKAAVTPPPTPRPTVTATATATTPPGCTDGASFVTDVTVPDNTNFNPGDAIHKVWQVKNTGTCTWNSQYTLAFASGEQMGASSSTPMTLTQPGSSLDVAVDMIAPSQDGTHRADFELHNPSGVAMPIDQAKTVWTIITVGTAAASTGGTPTSAPGRSSASGSAPSGTGSAGLLKSTCAFATDPARVNDVIAAINAYRTQNGRAAYTVDAQLASAAQSHGEDMACNNLFTHTGSDGSSPYSRAAAAGYSASSLTENVYGSYPPLTGGGVVIWWATDQTDLRHNQNLISSTYKDIGVGYAFYNNYGYFVVDFAAP